MLVNRLIKHQKDRLLTCRPDDSIKEAAVMLRSNHIGALPFATTIGASRASYRNADIVRAVADSMPKPWG